jgi:hypothetical protein
LQLVVDDIEAARAELAARGAPITEVFHDAGGVFHHAGTTGRVAGPAPDNQTYGSWASFSDPDGNTWYVQEVTTRLPGRVTFAAYDSVADLAEALRRAAAAHGKHGGGDRRVTAALRATIPPVCCALAPLSEARAQV